MLLTQAVIDAKFEILVACVVVLRTIFKRMVTFDTVLCFIRECLT